jgi:zinc-ribbon domain
VKLEINVEGKGGAYSGRIRGRRIIDVDALGGEMMIETLDQGMQSGAASVAVIISVDAPGNGIGGASVDRMAIIAQTSLKLFQVAAAATLAKYGDATQGALIGAFTPGGAAELHMSQEIACPSCGKRIPSSCRFCFNCGAKL